MAFGDDAPVVYSSPADRLPRAAMVSSDNTFEVSAVPTRLGFRGPVLFFVGQFRRDFLHATQLDPGRVEHPITIWLGESTNDLRAIRSSVPGVMGVAHERIEIPDPDHVDLDLLRIALAQAIVREWQRSLPVVPDAKPAQEPPAWLLTGVVRQIGGAHRLEDLDQVHTQWQRGRLPPLMELLAADPPVILQYPALQAVLAAWLLDHPGDGMSVLLRRLAGGAPWSPALVADALQVQKGIVGLSEAWDAWQVNAMLEIRQMGVTTPGMVRAFGAQLLLYPGDCGLPSADAWRGSTFTECLTWPTTPEVKEALRCKAMAIRNFSAGRDGALQRVARAYAAFLDAVATGESPEKLREMLTQAEAGRRQLEERTSKGQILHDPVEGQ